MEIQATNRDKIVMTMEFEEFTLSCPNAPDRSAVMIARMAGELMATASFLRERFAAEKEAAR